MALPLRSQWDVTHLAAKYPWLQVDQKALEEFRSPFQWVADDAPHSPAGLSANESDDKKHIPRQKKKKMQSRNRGEEGKQRRRKKRTKISAIARNHERIFANPNSADEENNTPATEKLPFPRTPSMPLISVPRPILRPERDIHDRSEDFDSVLEDFLQQDHEQLRKLRKKQNIRKKSPNLLALRFPVLMPKPAMSGPASSKRNKSPTPRTLLDRYSRQIKELTEEEEKLEKSVMTRIEAEKSRLPLTFLFERNLVQRSDAQQDGLRVVTAIFAKLQHRMLYNSYTQWVEFIKGAQHEDRKREALHLAQKRAVALLEQVSSDAYVGTLAQGFQRWKTAIQRMAEQERHVAAAVIQKAIRARRSTLQLEALRQAAKALDYRRGQAIQGLLRFERYGTTMRWGTLRIGFDFVKQNRAARNLQLFLRRVAVRRRIACRVMRREGAVRIQAEWRAHLARQEVMCRRIERAKRLAFEFKAATQMQRVARGFLARSEALSRRLWLVNAKQAVQLLIRWLKHQWFLATLHAKFNERKRMIDEARTRAAAEQIAKLHWRSVIAVQCILRGMLAKKIYQRKLRARQKEQAAVFLQRFWRRRTGLFALGLRFAERRERIAQCRLQDTIAIQCAFRCFRARRKRFFLAAEKETRRRAATILQRHTRGLITRRCYRKVLRALLTIQCSIRCALARRNRTRRQNAIHKLQRWIRGVFACRAAHKVLVALRIAAKRREASVILIQKLRRQYEAQYSAKLFREALSIVKIEQRRYFGSGNEGGIGWTTHQASSELLTYLTQRFLEDGSCFTTKELRWLRAQIQAANYRLETEDHAAVYLQRYYRGYATRLGFWVHQLQVEEHRRLQVRKAIVIQCAARRYLAKRFVRRVREKRRLAELKEAYIRERKMKEEERLWKERYEREQMELCVQRAQEAANQLREARIETDLARVKAEAAEYRAKELAAEREIETLLKTPVTKSGEVEIGEDEEKDLWIQLTDEYGNVYYYNESTQESSWDPPPPRKKKTKASPEEDKTKKAENEEDTSTKPEKTQETDPLEEILRQGKCIKCQQVPSTKRCLDCEGTNRSLYCTACFVQHSKSSSDENSSAASNIKHDFEVVPDAAVLPARCESSLQCTIDEENLPTSTNNQESAEKGLAAYYCYECTPKTSIESKLLTTKTGCFYCESCFARDHETVKMLRHAEKALRFRRGAFLCCDCGCSLAVRQCESCGGDKFCEACFTSSHTDSKRRSMKHVWTALDVLRDVLERETDRYCVECDVRTSSKLCNLCGDGFCDGCFDKTHAKGAKRRHTWLPWSVAAQHGDWIEIKDDKATVYFNVETKESTNIRPNVLLSGEERHRLELVEREQLQRSRQVELESEVVELKEQLRELQAQDRPVSRARTPATNSDSHKTDATDMKPAKQGVLRKLFGRKPPERPLTPQDRQRIAENLAERVRAEKQPVNSPVFQQAMVHELAALAVTSPQLRNS